MSDNPNAKDLLVKNLDKVDWSRLCGNPNSVRILEQNLDEQNLDESKGNGITDQNHPDFDWGVEGEDWEWEDEGDEECEEGDEYEGDEYEGDEYEGDGNSSQFCTGS